MTLANEKLSFSGHESFQCRNLWLKKGYDYVAQNRSFNDEEAVAVLGVGKNMVASIRFWLKAFNIITPKDEITEFGRNLLANNGWDPYLEDDASLWLLHYQLVKTNFASTYSVIFNEFRRERIEFTRENYVSYIKKRSEIEPNISFNQNTIEADFDVFKKMYLSSVDDSKSIEDSYSGLLCDLNLVKTYKKERQEQEGSKEKKTRYDCFYIETAEQNLLPVEIFLYSILNNRGYGNSISLLNLEQSINSPASIFAMNRAGLLDKIGELTENNNKIIFTDHAGIKELQFKEKIDSFNILKQYYES